MRDVAASFQEAVVDVLTRKAVRACKDEGVDHLMIGGGVAANSRLRALAQERCEAAGIRLRVPRPGLCTDNGAMVAALGAEMVARNRAASDLDLSADSSLPVTDPHVPGTRAPPRPRSCARGQQGQPLLMTVALMWEARAVAGRGAELLAWARARRASWRASRCAASCCARRRTGCWSSPGGRRRTTPSCPNSPSRTPELITRAVHRWRFEVAVPDSGPDIGRI